MLLAETSERCSKANNNSFVYGCLLYMNQLRKSWKTAKMHYCAVRINLLHSFAMQILFSIKTVTH